MARNAQTTKWLKEASREDLLALIAFLGDQSLEASILIYQCTHPEAAMI
jgi:hypothetical protein